MPPSAHVANPLVSVVVPVHGAAPFLEAALRTVAAQTHPAVEVVVVDDRAAPGLEERVRAVLPQASVASSRAPGLAAARNTGIAAGSGSLVAFLDSDDLWVAHKLERQVAALARSAAIGLVCSAFLELSAGEVTALRPRRATFREGNALLPLMLDDVAIPSAVVCRRAVLEEAGGFPEERDYFEDFALFSRLASMTAFSFVPEPLVLYRRHGGQMTQTVAGGVLEARAEMTREVLERLPAAAGDRSLRRRVASHDQALVGHWHRRQGRRGRAVAHAGRAAALRPLAAEPYALALSSVMPAALERSVRRVVQGRGARAELSPAVRAALALDVAQRMPSAEPTHERVALHRLTPLKLAFTRPGTLWDLLPRRGDLRSLRRYRRELGLWRVLHRGGYTLTSCQRGRMLNRLAADIEARGVPGALVDCGAWNGGSTLLLSNGAPSREAWAFDSFAGLPEPGELDGSYSTGWGGALQGSERRVREAFARFGDPGRLHVVPGWFEESFPRALPAIERVALLHADGDWYESVLLTLETFYPRVAPGGYVVIDDYGHWEGARRATDGYRHRHGIHAPLRRIDAIFGQEGGMPKIKSAGVYWRKP